MKLFRLIVVLHLVSYFHPNAPADQSPDSVVRELYQQVVARRPLGLPKGNDKSALWPFFSLRVIQKLGAAQTRYCGTHRPNEGWYLSRARATYVQGVL
jgi:hypothetical protein